MATAKLLKSDIDVSHMLSNRAGAPVPARRSSSHERSSRRRDREMRYKIVESPADVDSDDVPEHPPGCPMAMPWYRNLCVRIDELAEFCCCCRDRKDFDPGSKVRLDTCITCVVRRGYDWDGAVPTPVVLFFHFCLFS